MSRVVRAGKVKHETDGQRGKILYPRYMRAGKSLDKHHLIVMGFSDWLLQAVGVLLLCKKKTISKLEIVLNVLRRWQTRTHCPLKLLIYVSWANKRETFVADTKCFCNNVVVCHHHNTFCGHFD